MVRLASVLIAYLQLKSSSVLYKSSQSLDVIESLLGTETIDPLSQAVKRGYCNEDKSFSEQMEGRNTTQTELAALKQVEEGQSCVQGN